MFLESPNFRLFISLKIILVAPLFFTRWSERMQIFESPSNAFQGIRERVTVSSLLTSQIPLSISIVESTAPLIRYTEKSGLRTESAADPESLMG